MNRIALVEQLYAFQEVLFTEIKDGGTLDFEEYWNRKNFPDGLNTGSWHYIYPSGIGNYGTAWQLAPGTNYGKDFYLCRSTENNKMSTNTTSGCAIGTSEGTKFAINKDKTPNNNNQQYQRYGQYALQFWDFNGNANWDDGDEDRDGNIIGDEDDVNLWDGPSAVIEQDAKIAELYLIDTQKKVRTFFRWNIEADPNSTWDCNLSAWAGGIIPDGCRGNIQILRMKWHDIGIEHNNAGATAYDGKIDTWVCEKWWNCTGSDVTVWKIAVGNEKEWENIFPSSINVRYVSFEVFPRKDPWLAVAADDCNNADNTCISPFIHPYVKFSLELGFSHGKRRTLNAPFRQHFACVAINQSFS